MTPADILEALLRANLAATLAIALVLCLRRPARAAFGATAAYALWAMAPIAALASLLPAQSIFQDLLPSAPALPPDALAFIVRPDDAPSLGEALAPFAVAAWLLGVLASLAVLTIRQARLARAAGRLAAEPGDPSIARAERTDVGPAVIGVIVPRIVLPTDFRARYTPDEQAIIIAHERAHLQGGDTRVNALIALARCLAWFNPLVHVGAAYARLDQEIARDAAVAARFPDARRAYAEAMLKAQLAAGAVALGCGWTPRTAPLLKKRIAMLAKPSPTRARRIAGATLAVSASALVGLAAWAAQPDAQLTDQSPRPVQRLERQAPDAPRPVQRLAQAGQATPQPTPQPGGQPAQAGQGENDDITPLVRIAPAYPPEALAGDLTGRCVMSFDLTEEGATQNVTAECSDALFAASAIAAVERWRFEAGPARTGVQTVIAFELGDEEAPATPE